MDAHKHKDIKIMPKKGLGLYHVDRTQSTDVLLVERSVFVDRGLVVVRNNPHVLILVVKGWKEDETSPSRLL